MSSSGLGPRDASKYVYMGGGGRYASVVADLVRAAAAKPHSENAILLALVRSAYETRVQHGASFDLYVQTSRGRIELNALDPMDRAWALAWHPACAAEWNAFVEAACERMAARDLAAITGDGVLAPVPTPRPAVWADESDADESGNLSDAAADTDGSDGSGSGSDDDMDDAEADDGYDYADVLAAAGIYALDGPVPADAGAGWGAAPFALGGALPGMAPLAGAIPPSPVGGGAILPSPVGGGAHTHPHQGGMH